MPSHVDRTPENLAATRLLKARVAAGFTAGSLEAAPFHGWDVGRYGTDETGRKPIPADRAETYAEAFGVDGDWILHGSIPPGDDMSKVAVRTRLVDSLHRDDVSAVLVGLQGPSRSLAGGGARLRRARQAAGFASARAAAERLGWRHGSYAQNEHPGTRLLSGHCLVYGFAFGVEPEWLLLGERHSAAMSRHGGIIPGQEEVALYAGRVRAAMAAYVEARRPGSHAPAHDGSAGPGGA